MRRFEEGSTFLIVIEKGLPKKFLLATSATVTEEVRKGEVDWINVPGNASDETP